MKKFFKKILVTGLTLSLFAGANLPAFAAENYDISSEVPTDYFSENYQNELAKHNSLIEEYIGNLNPSSRSSASAVLAVPLIQQENGYYCGPACAQMIVRYLDSTNTITQAEIEDDMGMSTAGASPYEMKTFLNQYVSSKKYNYFFTTNTNFANNVVYSLDNDRPVVGLVKHSVLQPNSTSGGHYVVIKSYFHSGSPLNATIAYNDPHYNNNFFGNHTCSVSHMENAIEALNNPYYISASAS
ncbi:MAG: C39 family peptidase [Peptococcaceae bacterium]|nr:C39 family peptidase [Peptococcaceae bacterium]